MTVAGWVLAIDFGTSFTSVALNEGGRVELVEVDNVRAMPSGVWIDDSGSLVVGMSAERQARLAPQRWERSPKRFLGEVAPLLLGGERAVAVVDAVAAVLKHASQEACRRQGGPPEEVRLTYPARWGDRRRGALQAAAQIAGLGPPLVTRPPRLIPEPVAAALYFADRGALPSGAQVAVYDLGGGTFDSTVLSADGGGYTVRALGGLDNVGGETFDALLYAHVGAQLARLDASVWESLQNPPDARWRRAGDDLYREVRRAKEDLSKYASVNLDTADLVGRPVVLTRDELERVLRPRIESTAQELIDTIGRAGRRPGELTAVYLAGGSSRMPLVERVVSELLGVQAKVLGEPKSVVAIGAAKWSPQVRVDITPPSPAPGAPAEANPIMPTVPAIAPTRVIAGPPPEAQPTRVVPVPPPIPPLTPHPQPLAHQTPPYGYGAQPAPFVGLPYPGQSPPRQRLPGPHPPQQGPPPPPPPPAPKPRRRTGRVIGIVSLALIPVVGLVAVIWLVASQPLPAPSNLIATGTDDGVRLNWKAVSGADSYSVYRDGSQIAEDVTGTSYLDRLADSEDHSYHVTSIDAFGNESAPSTRRVGTKGQGGLTPGDHSPSPDASNLTAAQQELVDRLPTSIVDSDSCVAAEVLEDPKYTDAAVECDPSGSSEGGTPPRAVYAAHYRSAALYEADIDVFTKSKNLRQRSCSTPPAQDGWVLVRDPDKRIGKRYCYLSSLDKAVLQWNYDDDQIWLRAVANDDSHGDLLAWWKGLPDLVLR